MKNELKDSGLYNEKNSSIMGGVFLIFLGLIFYMSYSEIRPFGQSPWLLFILVPPFFVLMAAWNQYRANGNQLDKQVLATATFGLFPFIIGGMFAFGVGANVVLPIMFILLGLGVIVTQWK